MDGWKKLFHYIPCYTRSFQAVGADVSFRFVCTVFISGFLGWEGSYLGLQSFSFFFSYSLARCFFLDWLIDLFIFLWNYLNLLKLPLQLGLALAWCFSLLDSWLIYFLMKLSVLIKASPSLRFGPCRVFFLDLFIYLFSYETIWTYLKLPLHFGLVLSNSGWNWQLTELPRKALGCKSFLFCYT